MANYVSHWCKGKDGMKQMKDYRVRYWHQDQDGREDYMEFDTMEQAREFYNSLDGMAEIQQWNEKWGLWWTIQGPEFEV